jgi:hypothetical protein
MIIIFLLREGLSEIIFDWKNKKIEFKTTKEEAIIEDETEEVKESAFISMHNSRELESEKKVVTPKKIDLPKRDFIKKLHELERTIKKK